MLMLDARTKTIDRGGQARRAPRPRDGSVVRQFFLRQAEPAGVAGEGGAGLMSEKANQLRIGIFVVVGVAILLAALFLFGIRSALQPTYTLETYVPTTSRGSRWARSSSCAA